MASDLIITTVTPEVHQLPGFGTIEYTYNRHENVMCVSIAGKGYARFDGAVAENIFKNVAGFTPETDPFVNEANARAVAAWGHDIKQLSVRTRKREIVDERYIVMWWLKNNTKKSLTAIGAVIGGYDHATVLRAVGEVENLRSTNMDYQIKVDDFLTAL
jgi:hypothetical protein